MRLKVALSLIATGAVAVFLLAPMVSSSTYWPCGDACQYGDAAHPTYLAWYQSLSCAASGVGAGYSSAGAYGANRSPYQLACPPKVTDHVGHSAG